MSVVSIHNPNSGFFSCCSIKLFDIVEFLRITNKYPKSVDSSQMFSIYKNNKNRDISYDYFENYNNIKVKKMKIMSELCFNPLINTGNYSHIDYEKLNPIIKKYFYPSKRVLEKVNFLKNKYSIITDNCIAVYYRGTDKRKETTIGSFDDFFYGIKKVIDQNQTKSIIIQSDALDFIDFIKKKNLRNTIFISENVCSRTNLGIHNEQTPSQNYNQMFNLFATFLILSDCKYIVCNSGNCSLWMMLFRGNNNNTLQFLNDKWYTSNIDIMLDLLPMGNNDLDMCVNIEHFRKKMKKKVKKNFKK